MKPNTLPPLASPLLAAISLFLPFPDLWAQSSIRAMGRIDGSDGTIVEQAGDNPDLKGHTCSRLGTGDYLITVRDVSGPAESFIVETTMAGTESSDLACSAVVTGFITEDFLGVDFQSVRIRVRVADLASPGSTSNPVAADGDFFYAVRQFDLASTAVPERTLDLFASGAVNADGSLFAGFTPGGVRLACQSNGAGDYVLTLSSRPGEFNQTTFSADEASEYFLFLSGIGAGSDDQVVRGDLLSTASDTEVTFAVHTDDVQSEITGDGPVAEGQAFTFAIYRETDGVFITAHPEPFDHHLLGGAFAVDGPTGDLILGQTSIPNAQVGSERLGTGLYRITISAPGAFANELPNRYLPFVYVPAAILTGEFAGQVPPSDRVAKATTFIGGPGLFHIDVIVNDLELTSGNSGLPVDGDFQLLLVDVLPRTSPDLSTRKRADLPFVGDGIINSTGAGQRPTLQFPANATSRKFILRTRNAGQINDAPSFRVSRSVGSNLAEVEFRAIGEDGLGRLGDLSSIMRTGRPLVSLRPNEILILQGEIRYRAGSRTSPGKLGRRRGTITIRSLSTRGRFPGVDVNVLQVNPARRS